jgi:maltose/maltodextrin transport system substrate-binding protein
MQRSNEQLVIAALMIFSAAMAQAAPATTQATHPFHEQSLRESLIPIRPGKPGASPFWNEQAKQFIFAPAFNFSPIEGAKQYHFVVDCSDHRSRSFDSANPWDPLTPVWADIPPGTTRVRVEAINDSGKSIGVAGDRQFHRAAIFDGPYGAPVTSYRESARIALDGLIHEPFVQSWRTTGKPDPGYPLYRYSSKILGSLMSACAAYATQSARPADADHALEIGRRAADFLISISAAAGTALENLPPTYHDAKPTERENDNWNMLMTPAEAGRGYLDLYDATRDGKYVDAADHIASTYAKLQLPSGTWHLKVDNRTGEPLAPIDLIPSEVVNFLDRLVTQYKKREHAQSLQRAIKWISENPVRTMNWQAQFDDAKLRGAYQNLSKHEACQFAMYLFNHASDDPANVTTAEELLRFAEDQFVTWEQPPTDLKLRGENLKPQFWFTPCSLEQYAMFEPISGSSAWMIMTYVRAYNATHKDIYLAKAKSLANALTEAQQYHHGRYPTRMVKQDLAYWINSSMNTIRAMNELADVEERTRK